MQIDESHRALEQAANRVAMAEMNSPGLVTVVFAVGALLMLIVITAAVWAGFLDYHLFLPLASFLYYALYTPFHEAVHRNIAGPSIRLRWLDDAVGLAVGTATGISYALHRSEHMAHHRSANQPGDDPDHVFGRGVWGGILGSFWLLPAQYVYLLRAWGVLKQSERRRIVAETLLAALPRLFIIALGFWQEFLFYLLIPQVLGAFVTAMLFAWVVHYPHENTNRWGSTSVFHADGHKGRALTALWIFQNYHAVHHLFPRVPFYRYPRVFAQIEPTMVALGTPVFRLSLPAWRFERVQ